MKNSFVKKLALGMTAVMLVGSFAACGGSDDASKGDDAGKEGGAASDGNVLVAGYDQFSSKFSPFFSQTSYDQDAAAVTQVSLLELDREGNVVMHGIEGETRPYNGTDYEYKGIADLDIVQNEDGTVDYNFTMRDDIKFSDGTPASIDDAIFSMYVLADPTYDGSSTIYAVPIVGMDEYRSGMDMLGDVILRNGKDNTDFSLYTEEQQTEYIAAVEEAGTMLAQDIVDYLVKDNGMTSEEYGGSDVAMAMCNWGYGEMSEDLTKVTAPSGTEYDAAAVTTADFWNEIVANYEGDVQTAAETEKVDRNLNEILTETLGEEKLAEYMKGVSTGEGADHIEGIKKTGDYSMTVTTSKFDATAVYNLGVALAPLHYYGSKDLYDYDNNMFGFTKGDLSSVRAKTSTPLGAGPYEFQSYENAVITYTANENYYKGAPKTKTLLFRETSEGDKLSGVTSGTFDVCNPALSVEVLDNIKSANSNGELTGEKLTTVMTDFLGYGYIGINAKNIAVAGQQDSEESKALRTAFATLLASYRDTVVSSYYGEMASVINYPISNTSWAAPKPADDGYEIAYSKDVNGNPIYTAEMSDEERGAAALTAAIGFFEKAGYTFGADGKVASIPEGAKDTYSIVIPANGEGNHPSYGILTAAKEALATIGLTLDIQDPSDPNVLWDSINAGTIEMWCAAWGATPDPDMYQVYYSGNVVENGSGSKSNNYHVQDAQLDELIVAARESSDQSFRKATYKQCLDIIKGWGVEVPVYQRQDGFLFSTERINVDTLSQDMTPYWKWFNEIEKIEMN